MTVRVAELWRFPVKSLAGDRHPILPLDPRGGVGDRQWLVVDARGRFVTQRQLPAMARLHARLEGEQLVLRHLDRAGEEIALMPPQSGSGPITVEVWRDRCHAQDAGDAVAAWLSEQLGRTLRLGYLPKSVVRPVDIEYARPGDQVGFADGFPLLLCSQASIDYLARALGWQSLDARRFRANIIVSGGAPFAENRWRRVVINGVELELVKPCARCVIPSLDPDSALQQPQVLEALRVHCRGDDGQLYFGQNAIHRQLGALHVGAEVTVLDG